MIPKKLLFIEYFFSTNPFFDSLSTLVYLCATGTKKKEAFWSEITPQYYSNRTHAMAVLFVPVTKWDFYQFVYPMQKCFSHFFVRLSLSHPMNPWMNGLLSQKVSVEQKLLWSEKLLMIINKVVIVAFCEFVALAT